MLFEIPMNSERMSGLFLVLSCAITNSIDVVFIPSRRGVMRARSAADNRA